MRCCLTTRHFWQLKLSQPATNDIILVGNSRVYLGLSPRHIGKACNNLRIFNFGFVACSFDRHYLEHAASLLDMNGSKPALVLGLCPHCLRNSSVGNGYNYWSSQGNPDQKSLRRQIMLDNFCGKALLKTNARNVLNLSRGLPLNTYHADGWEASLPIRKRPDKYKKAVDKLARRKRVDMRMVDELLTTVADFRQKGISVYGYRPPSNKHIRYMEDRFSGLDYHDFARRFNGAGGSWLKVNEQAYVTYDGIHMDYRTAIRFSRHLGGLLRRQLDRN